MNYKRTKKIIGLLWAILLLHLIWLIGSLALNKSILPNPLSVYQHLPSLLIEGIGWHILVSLRRVFLGMGIALFVGTVLGLLMGRIKWLNQLFDPIIYLTYPIPKLALLPMIMLLFGLGEASKIILIVLIVFPQVVLSVRDGVLNIPQHYYDIYNCMQASAWQKFTKITLPASLSAVFSTSRISLGTAISVLFFTENYGTSYGMGYFIMDAWLRMDYLSMYSGILILSTLGFGLFLLIDQLGAIALKWQKER